MNIPLHFPKFTERNISLHYEKFTKINIPLHLPINPSIPKCSFKTIECICQVWYSFFHPKKNPAFVLSLTLSLAKRWLHLKYLVLLSSLETSRTQFLYLNCMFSSLVLSPGKDVIKKLKQYKSFHLISMHKCLEHRGILKKELCFLPFSFLSRYIIKFFILCQNMNNLVALFMLWLRDVD